MNRIDDARDARTVREPTRGVAASAAAAFLAYIVLTLALTWPIAAGIAHDVPSDFGDPLFTMWVLSWDATHLGAGLWNANIFYPHPLALAYSEHFLPQALQVLPIYLLTRNPILCYNLLFLSTFALSGLGMFLLARELTGSTAAGFVAGLAYAFAPYRIASLPHLQVLSSAWLPFALFGFRRYFSTGRARPLAGAAIAWSVQNLSCGYYFFFFTPVIAAYVLWELTVRRLWSDVRVVSAIAVTCLATAALTAPFMLPYLKVRALGFNARGSVEVDRFAADVYSYLTAPANLHVWGSIATAWPKAEGALFPGLTIAALATAGLLRAWRDARFSTPYTIATATLKAVLLALLFGWTLRLPFVKIASFGRAALIVLALATIAIASSRRLRSSCRRWLEQPAAPWAIVTLLAVVLSFGTHVTAKGRLVLEHAPYALLYRFVPGFDGLRVPSRFAMAVALGLAVLAGFGIAAIRDDRRRRLAAWAGGALIAIEFIAVPLPVNGNSTTYARSDLAPLPDTVSLGADAPAVYRFIAGLPSDAAIVELPLGEPAFDIRYMFYSTLHWKPLVNGYSGGAPAGYDLLSTSLQDVSTQPERAWRGLLDSNATHVVVHESFFARDAGALLSHWIRGRGGREVAQFGSDRVFELPR